MPFRKKGPQHRLGSSAGYFLKSRFSAKCTEFAAILRYFPRNAGVFSAAFITSVLARIANPPDAAPLGNLVLELSKTSTPLSDSALRNTGAVVCLIPSKGVKSSLRPRAADLELS